MNGQGLYRFHARANLVMADFAQRLPGWMGSWFRGRRGTNRYGEDEFEFRRESLNHLNRAAEVLVLLINSPNPAMLTWLTSHITN